MSRIIQYFRDHWHAILATGLAIGASGLLGKAGQSISIAVSTALSGVST